MHGAIFGTLAHASFIVGSITHHTKDTVLPSQRTPHIDLVPFVNRPFESEVHGTVNFTYFCCVLLVTWCQRVRFSCYLRPK